MRQTYLMVGDKIRVKDTQNTLLGAEGILLSLGDFMNPGKIKVTKSLCPLMPLKIGQEENLRCFSYHGYPNRNQFNENRVKLIKKGWAHRQFDYWNKKSLMQRIKWAIFGHF